MQWATENQAKSNEEDRGSTHTSLSLKGISSTLGNSMPTTVDCAAAWSMMNALSTLTSLGTFLVSTVMKFSQYTLDHPTNRPRFTQGSSMLVEPKSQHALPPSHHPSARVQLPYGNIWNLHWTMCRPHTQRCLFCTSLAMGLVPSTSSKGTFSSSVQSLTREDWEGPGIFSNPVTAKEHQMVLVLP